MTRDDRLSFVRAHRWAVVSTVSPSGEPHSAVVRFVITDAFELVFDTTDTTHKAADLRHNRKVAVVIGWDENQTIQIEGLADEPGSEELQHLKQIYSSRYPDYYRTRQAAKGLIYFRVRPRRVRYSDFRQNPANVITLDLVTGEESRAFVSFRGDA
jgi:general stress protein 26